MHSRLNMVIGLLSVAATFSWGTAKAEVRTFESPTYHGSPVAYCNFSGDLCGEEIARRWCINEGYETVSSWQLADGAGAIAADQSSGFTFITCRRQDSDFVAPTLGSFARATVFSPNRRSVATVVSPVQYYLTLPGCHQREPGVFMCETVHDYQHCRSLYRSGKVFGCRAGVAFSSQFAMPASADPGTYELKIESSAEATVQRGARGQGRLRGEAKYRLAFTQLPVPGDKMCLQRDRYVYHATGPMGGMDGIEETAECWEAIDGEFEPHEDDLIRAYDLCSAKDAWGQTIEQSIELLVAGLFHVADADAAEEAWLGPEDIEIVAPYVTVLAPMTVRCREQ